LTQADTCDDGEACDGTPADRSSDRAVATIGEIVGGDYTVTQDYGPTSFDGGYGYCGAYREPDGQLFHCGIDIGIPRGTVLASPGDAVVAVAGETDYFEDTGDPAAGELRVALSDGTEIILGHMSEIDVERGAEVALGQVCGRSGSQNGP